VSAPTPAPRFDAFNTTETRVVEAFGRGMTHGAIVAGRISGGEFVLTVRVHAHRQEVRGATLVDALARAETLYRSFTTQEAA
jgi:GTP cyclohydrolase II